MQNRTEKLTKDSLFYLFQNIIQINLIFSDIVRILSIYTNYYMARTNLAVRRDFVVVNHLNTTSVHVLQTSSNQKTIHTEYSVLMRCFSNIGAKCVLEMFYDLI